MSASALTSPSLRRNAVANIAGRAGSAVLWVVVTPLVLRLLGAERFGIWSLFFAFSAYLLALDLGLSSTVMRFVATARGESSQAGLRAALRRGLVLALGLGLVWGALVLAARGLLVGAFHVPPALQSETRGALTVFAFSAVILFPAQAMLAVLQGFERFTFSNLCYVAGIGAHVALLIMGLLAGGGLTAAAWAGLAGSAVTLALASLVARRLVGAAPAGPTETVAPWREQIAFAAALQLSSALIVLQLQASKLALAFWGNLAMVADFELAFRVASAAAGVPILALGAVIPAVSRAHQAGRDDEVERVYRRSSRWLFTISAGCLGLVWAVADDLVRIWLGPGHETVAPLLRLWTAAFAVNIVSGPACLTARGIGRPRWENLDLLLALAAQLALAAWWIPRLGAEGAVWAVLASFALGHVVLIGLFHAGTRIAFGPWLLGILLPRAVAGVAATWLTAWVLGRLAGWFPAPGFERGLAGAVIFTALAAMALAPLGDTGEFLNALRAPLRRWIPGLVPPGSSS
jgi:O-antigen/teichoic acid export membrane protein